MKKILLALSTLSILILPTLATAASAGTGAYTSVFLGVSLPDDTDVTTSQYSGPLSVFNDRIEFNPGLNIGATLGYDFGTARLEGEFSYKQNEMDKVTDRDTGFQYYGVDGDIGAFAFMANAFLDLHNSSAITPYFGGGVGLATLYLSDTFGTDSLGVRRVLYSEDDETVFAFQAGGGVDVALNSQTSLDIGYRYFETEKASFNSDWYQSKSLKFQSHNVSVGLRFKF